MIAQSVAEIINRHVKLTVEGIDRMYLNVFVAGLQYEQGIVRFFREHRGQPLPSAALTSPMTRTFVAKLEDFVARHEIELVQFEKGQRKDAVMAEHLRHFGHDEGIVFVGKAQERTPVFRTERRRSPTSGRPYPWIVRRSRAASLRAGRSGLPCHNCGIGLSRLRVARFEPSVRHDDKCPGRLG
jgi:hypothetical protein